LELLGRAIRQEEEINKNWKGSSQPDNMISYLTDPKNSIIKLLATINSVSKVTGYKIN
jgi:hypothetical protein